MKKWLIVVNKWTYLFLLCIPVGLIKIFGFDLHLENLADIGLQLFISLMIMAVGIYLFVRFNSYSAWMNPEYSKPKKD